MHKVINFFKGAASVRVNVTELEPQGKKKKNHKLFTNLRKITSYIIF